MSHEARVSSCGAAALGRRCRCGGGARNGAVREGKGGGGEGGTAGRHCVDAEGERRVTPAARGIRRPRRRATVAKMWCSRKSSRRTGAAAQCAGASRAHTHTHRHTHKHTYADRYSDSGIGVGGPRHVTVRRGSVRGGRAREAPTCSPPRRSGAAPVPTLRAGGSRGVAAPQRPPPRPPRRGAPRP